MLVRPSFPSLSLIPDRAVLARLRGLLARQAGWREDVNATLPLGLAALDSHLPNGGLACGALHEIVPTRQAALPAALGFVVAILSRLSSSYGAGLADGERTEAHCLPHGFQKWSPIWDRAANRFCHAGPCPAPMRPSVRTWPQGSRSQSAPRHRGRDGALARLAMGTRGSVALSCAASCRRNDR